MKKILLVLLLAIALMPKAKADDGKDFVKAFIGEMNMDAGHDDDLWLNYGYIEGNHVVMSLFMKDIDIDEMSSSDLSKMKNMLKKKMVDQYSAPGGKDELKMMFDAGYKLDIRFYDAFGRLLTSVVVDKHSVK